MGRFVTRPANVEWTVWQGDDGKYSYDSVQRAILLDIRQELRTLNAVFRCHNMLAIPHVLRAIDANTRKAKRRRTTKARTAK